MGKSVDVKLGTPDVLVLKTSVGGKVAIGLMILVAIALTIVLGSIAASPVNVWVYCGGATVVFSLWLLLRTHSTVYVIDAGGVERRGGGKRTVQIAWKDVEAITTTSSGSVKLVGPGGESTLVVPSTMPKSGEFLDLLERRPEYEHWLRAGLGASPEPMEGDDPTATAGPYPRRRPMVTFWIFAGVFWTLAILFSMNLQAFAGQHAQFRGRGALIALTWNFLFVDFPFAGMGVLFLLAAWCTYGALSTWHALRIEPEGLELDAILGTRSIPFDDVAEISYKLARVVHNNQVSARPPTLSIKTAAGKVVPLFAGARGLQVKDAIERTLGARPDSDARNEPIWLHS